MTPSIDEYRTGRRFILCDLLCRSDLINSPIVVIDVGAHDAFSDPRWTKIQHDKIRVHGFEPDIEECTALNETARAAGLDFHFHPTALAGRTGPAEFHRFAEPAANSFYAPNQRLIKRWCYGRSLPLTLQFVLKEKSSIQAISLDDWARTNGVNDIDFIKLNVQGAELDVISGAGARLNDVLGMVVEQTFTPTYIGAPMFGKVYDFIENAGFCMFDVAGMNRVARTNSPIHVTEDKIFVVSGIWPHHQFFEGHFFYMRDLLLNDETWNEGRSPPLEKCFKLACISEIFGQIEYAFEILEWIATSPGAGLVAAPTRKVIDQGAAIYRKASAGIDEIEADMNLHEHSIADLCIGGLASVADRVASIFARSANKLRRQRTRYRASRFRERD